MRKSVAMRTNPCGTVISVYLAVNIFPCAQTANVLLLGDCFEIHYICVRVGKYITVTLYRTLSLSRKTVYKSWIMMKRLLVFRNGGPEVRTGGAIFWNPYWNWDITLCDSRCHTSGMIIKN